MVRHIDSTCSLADAAPGSQEEAQLQNMEAAVKQLLVNVGEDPLREGLVDTPRVSGDCCPAAAAAAARPTLPPPACTCPHFSRAACLLPPCSAWRRPGWT